MERVDRLEMCSLVEIVECLLTYADAGYAGGGVPA